MAKKSRKTKQKEALALEIGKLGSFFTAEELYTKMNKQDGTIGIATIYRFLKNEKHKECLHAYTCGKKMIYSKHASNHCHFICEKCGKTIHFEITSLDFLEKKTPGDVCHFQVDVYGVCEKCKRDHSHKRASVLKTLNA